MLSSLKKHSDKSSASLVPAWHPNFRNLARLPDTKAVRTSFFINVLAISVVSALAVYTVYREYELNILRNDIAVAAVDIQSTKLRSDQSVALFKKFQDEERKVLELNAFLSASKVVVSDFILKLGDTIPQSVSLGSIDYRPTGVVLRGGIDGAPDEASGRAIAYVESLRENSFFSALFESVVLTNIVRDPGTGRMQFVIDLKFKPSLGAKK